MSNSINQCEPSSFTFIIPVRHPQGNKVKDYRSIEAALYETVKSLCRQTYENIHIVVVCHKVPDWSCKNNAKVTFLDINNSPVFPSNAWTQLDKGLKYIIGILYAQSNLNSRLIMLMDADDYVNASLAEYLMVKNNFKKSEDGYIINTGIHVEMEIQPNYTIDYRKAYIVKDFYATCGSCRIFYAQPLYQKINSLDSALKLKFDHWPCPDSNGAIEVSTELVNFLSEVTMDRVNEKNRINQNSIVSIIGRHVRLKNRDFKFLLLPFLGAAKGCGHGNHEGVRQGAIHYSRVTGNLSIDEFLNGFGLDNEIFEQKLDRWLVKPNFFDRVKWEIKSRLLCYLR